MIRRKMMNDLINQCQRIVSAFEHQEFERALAGIKRARQLLNGLEVLVGVAQWDADIEDAS